MPDAIPVDKAIYKGKRLTRKWPYKRHTWFRF